MAFARSVALRSGGQPFCSCRAYNFDYVTCCGKAKFIFYFSLIIQTVHQYLSLKSEFPL